jgi:tRNA dimethylallyltransferase
MGPTASGKTEVAEAIATNMEAQLVNADAFQIYRGMDIGTAKPIHKSAYRMIDIRNPSEGFGVGEYVQLVQGILLNCWEQGRSVVVVGGTGLYVRALFEEYSQMAPAPDPELRKALDKKSLEELIAELVTIDKDAAQRIDLKNRVRVQRFLERLHGSKPSVPVDLPPFQKLKLAVLRDPSETSDRITRRVDAMVQNGWVQEVKELADSGYSPADPGLRALGYKAIWEHLDGQIGLDEAVATTIAETKKYAKRQRTWLRSEPNLVLLESDNAITEASNNVMFYFSRE